MHWVPVCTRNVANVLTPATIANSASRIRTSATSVELVFQFLKHVYKRWVWDGGRSQVKQLVLVASALVGSSCFNFCMDFALHATHS